MGEIRHLDMPFALANKNNQHDLTTWIRKKLDKENSHAALPCPGDVLIHSSLTCSLPHLRCQPECFIAAA